MDWLVEILEKFKVPIATVVTVILLAIIFREQIAELIARITTIEIDPKKRRWQVHFGQRVKQEQKRATAIPRQVTASRVVPVLRPATDGGKQTGRDAVLEALGAVKQAVYDGCIANEIPITPTLEIQEAARRLGNVRGLSTELIKSIELVYELGREVARDGGLRPQDDDARAYWNLAYNMAQWMGLSVLVPVNEPAPAVPPPPPRRATEVGGNFVRPGPGNTTTALVGVDGPVRGQWFSIDKANYRLGRSPNNDLRVAADDSISGDHACLRYEKGGLFLSDQDSLNGTFLNERRVTRAPLMVRHGDRIRLGESVFEVVGTSPNSRVDEEKDKALKTPSNRSIVR